MIDPLQRVGVQRRTGAPAGILGRAPDLDLPRLAKGSPQTPSAVGRPGDRRPPTATLADRPRDARSFSTPWSVALLPPVLPSGKEIRRSKKSPVCRRFAATVGARPRGFEPLTFGSVDRTEGCDPARRSTTIPLEMGLFGPSSGACPRWLSGGDFGTFGPLLGHGRRRRGPTATAYERTIDQRQRSGYRTAPAAGAVRGLASRASEYVPCPDCAETAKFEARVCKHCGFAGSRCWPATCGLPRARRTRRTRAPGIVRKLLRAMGR